MLLTIGIPTFNGGKTIEKTLVTILNQVIQFNHEDIEVLISDNSSIDNTEIIIEEIQENYFGVNLIYRKNPYNVGFDRNVDQIMETAKGDYVWLISDDDYIKPDAIIKIMDILNNISGLGVIFVNYENGIILNTKKDMECKNGDDFLINSKFKSGLISSNIFNRSLYLNINRNQYFGTGWIHFGILIELINKTNSYIIVEDLIIVDGEQRWGGNGTFIYTGLKLVRLFRNMRILGFKKETIKRADFVIKHGYPLLIPIAIMRGLKVDYELIKEFIFLYKQYFTFWVFDLPLLLIPKSIYNLVYKTFKRFKNILRIS